jgi:hypothetical protein
MQCFESLHRGDKAMDNEITYRSLFNRFAQPDDKFDEECVEEFEDAIIEEGEVVAAHSWESDNPGAGAGMTLIYRFKGLFFTSNDFGLAEAVGLLAVRDTTERIWVDYKVKHDSRTDDHGDDDGEQGRMDN